MSDSGKRRIAAKQILADIRRGLDDSLLKQKYGLSDRSLDFVYTKLAEAGVLNEDEISNRSIRAASQSQALQENSLAPQWQCPSCHAAQASEKAECPICGIVMAKFTSRPECVRSLGGSPASVSHAEQSKIKKRVSVFASVVVLAGVGLAAAWFLLRVEPEPHTSASHIVRPPEIVKSNDNTNGLAIKDRAAVEISDIELQPLAELDFKTKSEILSLRSDLVSRYSHLIAGAYRPSNAVFGQIVDGAPWWGVWGAYHYGSGVRSIAGPSLHSESILNPYLLVAPDFNMRWRVGAFERIDEQSGHNLFYCPPRNLRWYPKLGLAEVAYDAECLRKNRPHSFSLVALNARDFNLNYIYVSYRDSRNIFKENEPAGAYENPQYIHRGGSCGYAGGCNNMSPQTPPIDDIQIVGWPVKVVIHLWERNPGPVQKPPDIEYIMYFE